MIKDFYEGKNILFTGGTGFVGKVILEKFFRSVGNFNKMYLLVRPKKGVYIKDRVRRDIFQSLCFENARQLPNFE
jgi:fatty acyl-CoA reductase